MLDAIRETFAGPPDPQGDDPEVPTLDADTETIAKAISNARRRHTIQYIHEHGESTLRDLSWYVASHETDDEVTPQDRKRAYVPLYQQHLSVLDDADAITYDKNHNVITPGRNLAGFYAIVSVIEDAGGEE